MAVTLTHSLRDYYHSSEVLLRIGALFKRISLEVNAFAESQSSIKHQMSASYVLAMEIQSLFGVQSHNESNIDTTQQTPKWSCDNGDETPFDQLIGQNGSALVT